MEALDHGEVLRRQVVPSALELVQVDQRHEGLIVGAHGFAILYDVKIAVASTDNQFLWQNGLSMALIITHLWRLTLIEHWHVATLLLLLIIEFL